MGVPEVARDAAWIIYGEAGQGEPRLVHAPLMHDVGEAAVAILVDVTESLFLPFLGCGWVCLSCNPPTSIFKQLCALSMTSHYIPGGCLYQSSCLCVVGHYSIFSFPRTKKRLILLLFKKIKLSLYYYLPSSCSLSLSLCS